MPKVMQDQIRPCKNPAKKRGSPALVVQVQMVLFGVRLFILKIERGCKTSPFRPNQLDTKQITQVYF